MRIIFLILTLLLNTLSMPVMASNMLRMLAMEADMMAMTETQSNQTHTSQPADVKTAASGSAHCQQMAVMSADDHSMPGSQSMPDRDTEPSCNTLSADDCKIRCELSTCSVNLLSPANVLSVSWQGGSEAINSLQFFSPGNHLESPYRPPLLG